MNRHGASEVTVKMLWGECRLKIAKWRCALDRLVVSAYPAGMDRSGLSPEVLKRCLDLNTRLPYREGYAALQVQGLDIGLSRCERLSQRYAEVVVAELEQWVSDHQDLESDAYALPKRYVVELDGVMVLEQDKPVKGQCEGREVKQALVYPLDDNTHQEHIAQALRSDEFEAWTQALLRQAGVKQHDELIAIADGAAWIDETFARLGVEQRILDVYHATEYLDTLMKALGYDEGLRQAHRASWCRGDIDARVWLKHYVTDKNIDTSTWSQEACSALRYLAKRLDQMAYWSFREKGYPIGSGAVEGANKSVIGARMKRSGMRWSKSGINRMAAMRSLQTTANPWIDFHQTRISAFN